MAIDFFTIILHYAAIVENQGGALMFRFFRRPKPTSHYGVQMDKPNETASEIDGFVDNLELADFLRKGYRIRSIGPAIPASDGIVVTVAEEVGL